MKTYLHLLTILMLTLSLNARENPFESTQAYNEEEARLLEMEADFPSKQYQKKSISEMDLEDMTPRKMPVNEPAEGAVYKTEAQINAEAFAKKTMMKMQKKEKEIKIAMKKALMAKKIADESIAMEKEKMQKQGPMLFVKLREDVTTTNSLEILPFLSIEYTDNSLDIHTKYKVFKKLYLPLENKLIIDFYGDVTFYTKRHDLQAANFKKIILGNHKKEKFFRVVLVTKNLPSLYDVTYDEDLVNISFNEEMTDSSN